MSLIHVLTYPMRLIQLCKHKSQKKSTQQPGILMRHIRTRTLWFWLSFCENWHSTAGTALCSWDQSLTRPSNTAQSSMESESYANEQTTLGTKEAPRYL